MKIIHIAAFTVLAVAITLSLPAAAQKAKAKKAFDKGVSAMEDHDYKAALESFQAAYKAAPHWMVLAHIGNCHAKLNDPVAAIKAYEQYLKDGGDDIPKDERSAARKNLAEQRKKVGVLHLLVKPKSADVRIDGDKYGNPPFEEILLKAGPHHILVVRDGEEEEKDISIYSGKELTVRMYPNDDSVAAVIAAPTPAPKKPDPVEEKPEPEPMVAEPEPEPEPEVPEDGVLLVTSNVEGAMVNLDGEPKGETPLEETVSAGPYTLEVGADGYMPYTSPITIEGGMVNSFDISLVDETAGVNERKKWIAVGISGGIGILGLGMGVAGWAVFGKNNSSEGNYADTLSAFEDQNPGINFDWNRTCVDRTLSAGSPQEYWCKTEWDRQQYEDKAKVGLGLGIAGTSVFVVGGTLAALFYFKPELFFGADSDANIIVTPVATGESTGLMMGGQF